MATSLVDDTTGSKVLSPPSHVQVIPDRSTAPTTVSISGSSAESAQLAVGVWELISTTNMHYIQGATGITATTSHHYLPAGARDYIYVTNATTRGYVAGIQAAAAGTLFLTRLTSKV